MVKLEPNKENRPPRTMAPAGKKEGNTTPGRRNKRIGTDNQYFEVGKVGRKTGITLRDTGIRDEHGLEPVSGIFSSPMSPERELARIPTSEDMDIQESSAPDVEHTLHMRKTPRLPPARQSTPRHTNLGSPKRMSSVKASTRGIPPRHSIAGSPHDSYDRPPANRVLDFTGTSNRSRKSLGVADSLSPFKPKKVLRRSHGPARPDVFTMDNAIEMDPSPPSPGDQLDEHVEASEEEDVEESIELSPQHDDEPLMMDFAEQYDDAQPEPTNVSIEIQQAGAAHDAHEKRGRGRPRLSEQSLNSSQIQHATPSASTQAPSTGQKRHRASLESAHVDFEDEAQQEPSSKKKKGRRSTAEHVVVHRDDGLETIDPALLAHGDSYVVDTEAYASLAPPEVEAGAEDETPVEAEPVKKRRGRPKGKGKAAAPKERDPNRPSQPARSSGSPSKGESRGGSAGPISNVNLRAATPFEDAGHQTSRFGRNLIQPLQYWKNENRIWRNGEVEGIIRAEAVEKITSRPKKKRRKGKHVKLDGIEEESESESVVADEWEDGLGVITGHVASWDPVNKIGNANFPVQEDLAFAASAIVTRDVAGSEFRYAKIMTVPFFGAGLVELPPEGFKRAKNSRKMQMIFFVHEGKVMVEVGATGMEVNQFNITKGGAWVVPRGNNYSITNESHTTTAKVFFAQGCVVDEQ